MIWREDGVVQASVCDYPVFCFFCRIGFGDDPVVVSCGKEIVLDFVDQVQFALVVDAVGPCNLSMVIM